jgi:putative acetyltransferase
MSITVERVMAVTSEVRALVEALDQALAALYVPEQCHGLSLDRLFEPNLRFFVARIEGESAGCGGVALFSDYAEVKRMYTKAALRGRGVAKAVLRRLEAEARSAGVTVLRLETGKHQPEAIGLYEESGFRRRSAFGPYAEMPASAVALSLFYEKPL